jgi:hypothetical protein
MNDTDDFFSTDDDSREHWCVAQCGCGHITLRLGETERTFSVEEFAQLHRLLEEAMRTFRIAPSELPIVRGGSTTRH